MRQQARNVHSTAGIAEAADIAVRRDQRFAPSMMLPNRT